MRCDGFCEYLLESGLCLQEESQCVSAGNARIFLQSPGMLWTPWSQRQILVLDPLNCRNYTSHFTLVLEYLHQSRWIKPLLRKVLNHAGKAQHTSNLLGLEDLQANSYLQFCACHTLAEGGWLGWNKNGAERFHRPWGVQVAFPWNWTLWHNTWAGSNLRCYLCLSPTRRLHRVVSGLGMQS